MWYQIYIIHTNSDTVNVVENISSLGSLSTRHQLPSTILVNDILNNLIDCTELLSVIGFRKSCRNIRKLDLFVVSSYTMCSEGK